jgi:energy-coupling factor transport system permease protein
MGLSPMGSIDRKRIMRKIRRRPHPLALFSFLLTFAVELFCLNNLVLQLSTLLVLLAFTVLSARGLTRSGLTKLGTFMRFAIPFMALYTLIGASFAHPGEHILWQRPHVPLLGTLAMSRESITASLTLALRMWNLLMLMFTFGERVRPEDIVFLLRPPFARVALTISMVMNFIPQLIAERRRILDVAMTRGFRLESTKRRDRVRALATIYQTLLQNALERSWSLAESMHMRGYGSPGRSFYRPPKFRVPDATAVGICAAILLALIGVALQGLSRGRDVLAPLTFVVLTVLLFWLGGRARESH